MTKKKKAQPLSARLPRSTRRRRRRCRRSLLPARPLLADHAVPPFTESPTLLVFSISSSIPRIVTDAQTATEAAFSRLSCPLPEARPPPPWRCLCSSRVGIGVRRRHRGQPDRQICSRSAVAHEGGADAARPPPECLQVVQVARHLFGGKLLQMRAF
ncbi:hypothetical protein EJB05_26083, partial [Eragrostis curvula]